MFMIHIQQYNCPLQGFILWRDILMATTQGDICVQFTLDGRDFEAVGFLNEGESSATGIEMIRRTNKDNNVVSEHEEWYFIWKHYAELPKELLNYLLITNRQEPGQPTLIYYFGWTGRECKGWLENRWSDKCLVLRRRQ